MVKIILNRGNFFNFLSASIFDETFASKIIMYEYTVPARN